MQIWLETTNLKAIHKAEELGALHGVSATSYLLAHPKRTLEELIRDLMEVQKGPIGVQIMDSQTDQIVRQAESLYHRFPRLMSKIFVTYEGLRAITILSKKKIPTIAEGVFDSNQMLLAARAGAEYIVPHYARICGAEMDGLERFYKMKELLSRYKYPSKILAFIETAEHARTCADLGVDAVSMGEKSFNDYVQDHPWTLELIAKSKKEFGETTFLK